VAAQAAGTNCTLSESCVGTTTQRCSCDVGLLAKAWVMKVCREFAIRSGSRANRRLTAGQVTTNAIAADDSSAHPDQPGDCGLALSAVGTG
jgi:hypothetical protein